MFSKEYTKFSTAFKKEPTEKKVKWLNKHRKTLIAVAEKENCDVYNILLRLIHLQKLDKTLTAEIFKNHLPFIKHEHVVSVGNSLLGDEAGEVINAWDEQSRVPYGSLDKLKEVAYFIQEKDLVAFCERHQSLMRVSATMHGYRGYRFVCELIMQRSDEMSHEVVLQLFMPYINDIENWTDFNVIKMILEKQKYQEVLSCLCMVWKNNRDQKPGVALLSSIDLAFFFEEILLDEDRVEFIKTCLPQIREYATAMEQTPFGFLKQLYLFVETEKPAWDFAMLFFPYLEGKYDFDDLKNYWRFVTVNDRIQKETYEEEAVNRIVDRFDRKFKRVQKNNREVSVSDNKQTMFGDIRRVTSQTHQAKQQRLAK